jgi:hypothetical protein
MNTRRTTRTSLSGQAGWQLTCLTQRPMGMGQIRVGRKSETATDAEVRTMEVRPIGEHRSNDPVIGYNRSPRFLD